MKLLIHDCPSDTEFQDFSFCRNAGDRLSVALPQELDDLPEHLRNLFVHIKTGFR